MVDYGEMNAPAAADGRNWKSGGAISVDGVLYMSVGMDRYVDPNYGGRQTRINASIIKSTDQGLHWTRAMQENLERPMFPCMRFATPFLFITAKTIRRRQWITPIATSMRRPTMVFGTTATTTFRGRVLRSKIGALKAEDWSFYRGGDGMVDSSWSADMTRAHILIEAPGQCGETGMTYLPALNRYVMAAWYYPIGNGHAGKIEATEFAFYESAKPWGPSRKIKTILIEPQGWYIPRVLAKFQSPAGQDLQAFIAVAGDWRNPAYYRYTRVPVKFLTAPPFPVGHLSRLPGNPPW